MENINDMPVENEGFEVEIDNDAGVLEAEVEGEQGERKMDRRSTNLDEALENLSIGSFHLSDDGDQNSTEDVRSAGSCSSDGGDDWKQLSTRTEIYSKHYKPSAEEQRKVDDFLTSYNKIHFIEPEEKKPVLSVLKLFSRDPTRQKLAPSGANQPDRPPHLESNTILLHRQGDAMCNGNDCELVLFSTLLLVRTRHLDNQMNVFDSEREIPWSTVESIEPDFTTPSDWKITIHDKDEFVLFCPNRDEWLETLFNVLLEYHLHHPSSSTESTGWIYQIVRSRVPFSIAVTNIVPPGLDGLGEEEVDEFDQHGFTPLHYASRLGHGLATSFLLHQGANVQSKDTDGRTPMYYAARDENDEVMSILKKYDAEDSELLETERRGYLFGQAAVTQAKVDQIREQRQQAQAAQAQMAENMQKLRERGEKIEELDDKAQELNRNAAEYQSLARQLKEQTAARNKWMPFF